MEARLEEGPDLELLDMSRRFKWAVVFTTPLFAIAMLGQARSEHAAAAHEPSRTLRYPILFLACGIVAVGVFPRVIVITFENALFTPSETVNLT